jgi:hypothetical protein
MPVRAVVACVVLGSVFCGVAALLLWLGFGQADGVPTCSGRPMRGSDACVVDGHPLSYADVAGDDRRLHLFGRVVGLAMGASGVVLVGAGVRGGIRRIGRCGVGRRGGLALARTDPEARLYISMCRCTCGETDFAPLVTTGCIDDVPVRRYAGFCPACKTLRAFTFCFPAGPVPTRPGEIVFGDGSPSELLDPGLWWGVADGCATSGFSEGRPLGEQERRLARDRLATAAAAMDEVLAFVPAGASKVPAAAFASTAGRRIRRKDPRRFDRDRLARTRADYRQRLAEIERG